MYNSQTEESWKTTKADHATDWVNVKKNKSEEHSVEQISLTKKKIPAWSRNLLAASLVGSAVETSLEIFPPHDIE